MALFVALFITPNSHVYASSGNFNGENLNDTGDGLHAYMSTMNMTTHGGPFTFTTISPNGDQDYYMHVVAPGGDCLEVVTMAERLSAASTTSHYLGVYNLCTASWVWFQDLSSSGIRAKYARVITWNDTGTAFDDEVIETRIIDNGNNCFAAYLWNANLNDYENVGSYCGSTGTSLAYVGFEYSGHTMDSPNPQCPTMGGYYVWQVRGLQERHGIGNWSNITSSDINGAATTTMYCFNTVALYQVMSVAPQIFKIRAPNLNY